jgi:hypothetical protein
MRMRQHLDGRLADQCIPALKRRFFVCRHNVHDGFLFTWAAFALRGRKEEESRL